jgi:hypothetical protein
MTKIAAAAATSIVVESPIAVFSHGAEARNATGTITNGKALSPSRFVFEAAIKASCFLLFDMFDSQKDNQTCHIWTSLSSPALPLPA